MQPLAATDLLSAYERGRGMPPVRQALLLLEAACPGVPRAELAALPVGLRDARLLALRARTFGPMAGETRCPACQERLELDLRSADLGVEAALAAEALPPIRVCHEGYEVTVRLPTSADLIEAGDGEEGERRLLTRLVVEARRGGETVAAEALPVEVRAALGDALAAADPMADLQLVLACPACEHGWSETLDPVAFVWAEVQTWAPRLLRDVHRLASAYGWAERDVLAMSAWRREQYLTLLSA